jgi:hypothetical protein
MGFNIYPRQFKFKHITLLLCGSKPKRHYKFRRARLIAVRHGSVLIALVQFLVDKIAVL